ncbi:MAG: flagellar hook basal-body protein [Nitrospirae bacterium]|nr:flagellar hook basal-body protein [Nitrospirota bacterium]
MYKGIYTSLSGAMTRDAYVDVIAQNLANISTTGYKRDTLSFRSYLLGEGLPSNPPGLYPESKTYTAMGGAGADFSEGEIFSTGNPLDLAISGPGFFELETPAGLRYSRNGAFRMNSGGEVITPEGFKLMTDKGPLKIAANDTLALDRSGKVIVNGGEAGRLRVVGLENAAKEGGGLFTGTPVEFKADLMQGALEQSNVKPFREMVTLIDAFRAYETSQKMITSFDTISQRAVNDIARV